MDKAFSPGREPRSAEYKRGVHDMLVRRIEGVRLRFPMIRLVRSVMLSTLVGMRQTQSGERLGQSRDPRIKAAPIVSEGIHHD